MTCATTSCGADPALHQGYAAVTPPVASPSGSEAPVTEVRTPSPGASVRRAFYAHLWWNAVLTWNWHQAIRMAEAVEQRHVTQSRVGQTTRRSGHCGGDLPSCAILRCESHGDPRAENPHSTASGKWQVLDSTWGGYRGYAHAADAPEWVQDERARQIYAGGRGRSQWSC